MGDLLEVLRHLALGGAAQRLMDEPTEMAVDGADYDVSLTPEEQLQCCVAAFRIVKGALDALNVDLRDFYVRLYQLLWEVPFEKR
jgi:nucleolar complex protein 3